MKRLADGLHMLSGFPPNGINVYLMGDVLVDAGTRHSRAAHLPPARRATGRARTRSPTRTPTTRAPAATVCERLGIELWCGERDADGDGERRPGPEGPPASTS